MYKITLMMMCAFICFSQADEKFFKSVFDKHCMACHDTDTEEGEFDIEKLSFNLNSTEVLDRWVRIYDLIESGEMPNKEKYKLPKEVRAQFLSKAERLIITAEVEADLAFAIPDARKRNNYEIQNSLKDIFGADLAYNPFLAPNRKLNGFDNQAELSTISGEFTVSYLRYIDEYLELISSPIKTESTILKDRKGALSKVVTMTDKNKRVKQDGIYEISFDVTPFGVKEDVEIFVKPGFKKRGAGSPIKEMWLRKYGGLKGSDHQQPELFVVPKNTKTTIKSRRYLLEGEAFTVFSSDEGAKYRAPKGKGKGKGKTKVTNPLGIDIKNIKVVGPIHQQQAFPQTEVGLLSYLKKVLPLVYQRHLSGSEWKSVQSMVGKDIKQSFKTILRLALLSPEFLYNRKGDNINYHIAARMSLFLWRSVPDQDLLNLARDGKLMDAKTRVAQAKRMVADSRFKRFQIDFLDQWFEQDMYYDNAFPTIVNKEFYDRPQLLLYSMLEQNNLLFQRVLEENLSLMDLVDSKWTFMNQRLEKLYGLESKQKNNEMKLYQLPENSDRGGLLNQGALMRITSVVDETSPVKRGVWMAANILSVYIPEPPDDVEPIVPDVSKAKSLKELFKIHRSDKGCAGCHAKFDPVGFVFESYDSVGKFRTHYDPEFQIIRKRVVVEKGAKAEPIDTQPFDYRGKKLKSMQDFKNYILKHPEETFIKSFLDKITAFSLGRKPHFNDRQYLKKIMDGTSPKGYKALDMMYQFIASDLFEIH